MSRPVFAHIILILVLGCDSNPIGDRVPADLNGTWRGDGKAVVDGQTLRIALTFYLIDNGGHVGGTAAVASVGRGTDRLSVRGRYQDVDLNLVITDATTGDSVLFDGWASGEDMGGELYGDPLVVDYEATLKKFVAPGSARGGSGAGGPIKMPAAPAR